MKEIKQTKNFFENWLDENGLEVGMVMHGNCAVVCRKDGKPIKESFMAMSPEDLFNAGIQVKYAEYQKQVDELKAQIEKMKCCAICRHVGDFGVCLCNEECHHKDKFELEE